MTVTKEAIPLVTVRCITYNQVNYIRDCLEGFVSQNTSFPFEVVVHDDASSDGTIDIIKEYASKYPEIIKPIFEVENQWSKHNGIIAKLLQENTRGKYVAYCEGDDYWINKYHLETMVRFMEEHEDVGLCYSMCKNFHEVEKRFEKKAWGGAGRSFVDLIKKNCVPTLTVVYRNSLDLKYISYREKYIESKDWTMGDYPRWLWFAANSKIHFFKSIDGVYRILPESASHSKDYLKRVRFIQSYCSIRKTFCIDYGKGRSKRKLIKLINNQCNWNLLMVYLNNGLIEDARRCHKEITVYSIKSFLQYIVGFMRLKMTHQKSSKSW